MKKILMFLFSTCTISYGQCEFEIIQKGNGNEYVAFKHETICKYNQDNVDYIFQLALIKEKNSEKYFLHLLLDISDVIPELLTNKIALEFDDKEVTSFYIAGKSNNIIGEKSTSLGAYYYVGNSKEIIDSLRNKKLSSIYYEINNELFREKIEFNYDLLNNQLKCNN